jgi:futalosine hydrolase
MFGNIALYGYKQIVVVAMPVGVGAFAENFGIFLCAPLLAVHPVGGVKVFPARNMYHHNNCGCKYTKQKQGRCFILAVKYFAMRILFVAATEMEVGKLAADLRFSVYDCDRAAHIADDLKNAFNQADVSMLITGAGMVATAYALGKHFARHTFDLAINLGICGSFDKNIPLGEVLEITHDILAELGAEDNEDFITIDKLGFGESSFTSTYKLPAQLNLKQASAITVNTVHGNQASIEKLSARINAQLESMEGAAFFYACRQAGIPCMQIRAVSNYVEKRNRDAWQIGLAVKNLNTFAVEFLNSLA